MVRGWVDWMLEAWFGGGSILSRFAMTATGKVFIAPCILVERHVIPAVVLCD
jgi:hypothetical protein